MNWNTIRLIIKNWIETLKDFNRCDYRIESDESRRGESNSWFENYFWFLNRKLNWEGYCLDININGWLILIGSLKRKIDSVTEFVGALLINEPWRGSCWIELMVIKGSKNRIEDGSIWKREREEYVYIPCAEEYLYNGAKYGKTRRRIKPIFNAGSLGGLYKSLFYYIT